MIAVPEIGQMALILALVSALVLAGLAMAGAQRWLSWTSVVVPGAVALAALVSVAFACLAWSFVANDFSLRIVADNSNSLLPAPYRFAATWGSHEGSLLLWALLLVAWMVAVAVLAPAGRSRARVVGVMAAVAAGFLAFLVFASNPFVRLFPSPLEGRDLNPLLQDPAMVLHPPLLYMGYVGFAVVFGFALAGLIENRVDAAWARWVRPWTTMAWAFLTLGIVLGSRWAYYELGWGGWWFWDPVENASFMPWLCGTALIHSLAVTDTRGESKKWTLLLAILTFSLSLLGTFLVRSGVLTSVHAFAIDPLRGVFILGFLAVVVGGSLALFVWRAPTIEAGPGFSPMSRETLLLLNNLVLSVAAGVVLLGTLYPLVVDALGLGKISIGPPYFNAVFVPLAVALLFLMGVGPLVRWKRARLPDLARSLRWAAAAAVVAAALLPAMAGDWRAGPALGFGLAAWTLAGALIALIGAAKGRTPARHVVGMSLAHAGLAVFVLGVTAVTHYEDRREVKLAPGDTVRLGEIVFRLAGTETVFGPNWVASRANIEVERDGIRIAQLFPEKRRYHASGITLTEAAIDAGITRDLFVSLGEPLADGAWTVRVHRKPMVEWIFAGFTIMALGGLVAASGRRLRGTAEQKKAAVRHAEGVA